MKRPRVHLDVHSLARRSGPLKTAGARVAPRVAVGITGRRMARVALSGFALLSFARFEGADALGLAVAGGSLLAMAGITPRPRRGIGRGS